MLSTSSQIINTLEQLDEWLKHTSTQTLFVADVETYTTDPSNGKLLGIAICSLNEPGCPVYVCLQWYDHLSSTWHANASLEAFKSKLKAFISKVELVGHNYAYDKHWIDYTLGTASKWRACTRLMWHISSAPSGPRPYGLKDAQIEVLGWVKKGSDEVNAQVTARGGKLKEGGHYLADVEVLGKYACLDASSTALLYISLSSFFDKYDYWWMLEKMVEYSWLLQECTNHGVLVDKDSLDSHIQVLKDTKGAYSSLFLELTSTEINRLERIWRDDRSAKYTIPSARERFLSSWEMQKKFNLSSDKDKRELFYTIMKLPIVEETDGGKGSTSLEAIKLSFNKVKNNNEYFNELLEIYEQAESSETILNSFAKPWLDSIGTDGRLHPRFNPCGTVSYRLSGFKPYLLNAPFDEHELMSCLKCDDGYGGVHADFVSVEPAVTAHYSQDPSLLKVFKEGRGDVYLDLGLTLFPNNMELKDGYNPNLEVTREVKERFKEQRKIAKIIQLAVQYTGTRYTVHKNLTHAGVEITLNEADELVKAYWRHFKKVAVMNEALFIKFDKQGYLRNVVGRIIRVPTSIPIRKLDGTIWDKPIPRYKDLPNRFIQSSAHDLLSFWVIEIYRLVKLYNLKAKPILIDCHDSTSWQAPLEQVPKLKEIFIEALTTINSQVKMTVPIKIEVKTFNTLAGLKGEDK